ncbi:MAG: copper amine oxidase N-terminal domain-containing protein [Dethiobacteria bacterium]
MLGRWKIKAVFGLLTIIIALQFAVPALATEISLEGEIVDGRFLVPMRGIFEALGAVVAWDGETRTVTGTRGDITVKLTIDSKTATVNENIIELDVPATIIDGRTFVPTRFVGESLGANVSWDQVNRIATISQEGTVIKVFESEQEELITEEIMNNKNKLLNPSDTIILEAITEGKKGYANVNRLNNSIFKLPVEKSNLFDFTPEAWAQTPYFIIMRASVLEDIKYRELTLTEAKRLIPNNFAFELKTYGTSIIMGSTFHFVLEQNNKIIQPSDIKELMQFAERTSTWPNDPAYYKVYHVYYPVNEINFDEPATLIFLYAGKEMSASFIVDFSKLK